MSSSNVPAAALPSGPIVVVPTGGGEVKTVPAFPFPVDDSQLVDIKTWGIGNEIPEPDLSLTNFTMMTYDDAVGRLQDLDELHAVEMFMRHEDTFYQHLDDRFDDIKSARYKTTMRDYVKYQCRVCGRKLISSLTLRSHVGTKKKPPTCRVLKGIADPPSP